MIGVVHDRRAVQMVNRIDAPVVLVGELGSQTIDIPAPPLEREIPEHMIKRAVLEHQHDDVVNFLQVHQPTPLSHEKLRIQASTVQPGDCCAPRPRPPAGSYERLRVTTSANPTLSARCDGLR
jgi:hypothetical protein